MQLLLARRVNDHVLPACVTFVAATNRRNDRAGVTGILETVKSRFAAIVGLSVDLDDWCLWAQANGIPETLIAFMRFRQGDMLDGFNPTADLTNCPLPRTWAHAAKILKMKLGNDEVEFAAMAGAVGEGAATEYFAYQRSVGVLPSIDEIFQTPNKPKLPTEPAILYAVATAVACRATEANYDAVCAYCERLVDAAKSEFATIILRDSMRRLDHEKIGRTKAFARLTSGKLGNLFRAASV
jgi:hypothetical protein